MKKIALLASLLLIFNVNAMACLLDIYIDTTESGSFIFNIISTDNKFQYTTTTPITPSKKADFNGVPCVAYNIYAQKLNVKGDDRENPYGDYVYTYNPLQLSGELTLYFPRDFQLDPLLSANKPKQ